ncbi:MAG: hypothetical protein ACOH1J_07945 [Microbacteriaceae bacterium]
MTDIDTTLRATFVRIAPPADPSGVAELIRTRISHGDAGIPSESSGFAGSVANQPLKKWLTWLSVLVMSAIVVSALIMVLANAHGAFGEPGWGALNSPATEPQGSSGSDPSPNGAEPTAEPTSAPTSGPTSRPSGTTPAPPPVQEITKPSVAPNPPIPPPAPTDSSPPQLSQAWVTPYEVYNGELTTTGVIANDNVAVSSVSVSWAGPSSAGTGTMANLGNDRWSFQFYPPTNDYGMYTITMTATDAQGNRSPPATVRFLHVFFG